MIPILLAIFLATLVSTVYIGYRISMLQGDIYGLRNRVSSLERHVAALKDVSEQVDRIERRIVTIDASLEVLVASQAELVAALHRQDNQTGVNDADQRH